MGHYLKEPCTTVELAKDGELVFLPHSAVPPLPVISPLFRPGWQQIRQFTLEQGGEKVWRGVLGALHVSVCLRYVMKPCDIRRITQGSLITFNNGLEPIKKKLGGGLWGDRVSVCRVGILF